jgi:hypothetical protein
MVSSIETPDILDRPGTLAYTNPAESDIASMVIHTTFVSADSLQIVEAVIDENSFVKLVSLTVLILLLSFN